MKTTGVALFCVYMTIMSLGSVTSSKLKSRIVQGVEAEDRVHSQSVVSVRLNGVHHMGGCILDSTRILTAFGPIYDYVYQSKIEAIGMLSVYAGSNSRTQNGILKFVKDIFYYPEYVNPPDFHARHNDICVLELTEGIEKENGRIDYVKLPEENDPVKRETLGTVSGWGITDFNHHFMPDTLRYLEVMVAPKSFCSKETIKFSRQVQFCIAYTTYGPNLGNRGDYGSPLLLQNGKVIGIASTSGTIAAAFFTKVSAFIHFINGTMNRPEPKYFKKNSKVSAGPSYIRD